MYQQIRLSDTSLVGSPGPLPANLVGLSDAALADLSAAISPAPPGLDGMAFWPMTVTTPTYDASKQVAVPPASYVADASTHTVTGTATVRDMTADEYAAAHPTPDVISDRQCFQELAVMGKITQDDALQAVTVGVLPKVITDGIASLPADQQFPARMMLCGATQFSREHPMTPVLGAFLQLDSPGLDALWRAAALL